MKRKGYKDVQEQIKANERYLDNNPEAKAKANRSRLKSTCYRFVRDFATVMELKDIYKITREELKMLKKLYAEWRDISEDMLRDGYSGSVECAEGCVLEDFNNFLKDYNHKPITMEEMEELQGDYNWEHECSTTVRYRLTEQVFDDKYYIKDSGDYKVEIESYKVVGDSEDMIDTEHVGYIDEEELSNLKYFVENRCEVLKGDFAKKVNIIKETDDGYETIDVYYPALRK